MKHKFEEMSRKELIAYVLEHREDIDAVENLFSRRSPDSEAKRYPAPCTPEGVPIPENIRIMEEAIRQRIEEIDRKKKSQP